MKLRYASTALAAMLTMAGSVQAANTASAAITNFSITLIDTDLNDGIAAAITFQDLYGYGYGTYVHSQAYSYSDQGYNSDYDYDYGTFQNSFLQANSASAAVKYANTQVDTTENSITMSASAHVIGPNTTASDYSVASSQAYPFWLGNNSFTLSANTLMLVRGSFSLAVNVDAVGDTIYSDSASASYSLGGSLNTAGISQNFSSSLAVYAYSYAPYGYPAYDSATGVLYGALFNGGSDEVSGTLNLSVSVSAVDYTVTPVPEVSSMALALTGLGVVGGVVWRRRKG